MAQARAPADFVTRMAVIARDGTSVHQIKLFCSTLCCDSLLLGFHEPCGCPGPRLMGGPTPQTALRPSTRPSTAGPRHPERGRSFVSRAVKTTTLLKTRPDSFAKLGDYQISWRALDEGRAGCLIAPAFIQPLHGPALSMFAGWPPVRWVDLPVGSGQAFRQKRGQCLHLGTAGARRRGYEIEAAKGHAPIGKQGFDLARPQQIEGDEFRQLGDGETREQRRE
jgi:hypothetical protein